MFYRSALSTSEPAIAETLASRISVFSLVGVGWVFFGIFGRVEFIYFQF